MRKLLQIGSVVLTAMSLMACGSDKKDAGTPVSTAVVQNNLPGTIQGQQMCLNKNLPGQYFYRFYDGVAGCSTGRQTFMTLQDKCTALMDDARNNNCAKQFRINEYNTECACNVPLVNQPVIPSVATGANSNYRQIVCSISGSDLSGGFFSGFKNRDNLKSFSWNSRKNDSFSLPFGLTDKYGSARLSLTPAAKGQSAKAKITLKQDEGVKVYSAEGDLDGALRLSIDDQENKTSIVIECSAQNTQSLVKNISKVVCTNTLNSHRQSDTNVKPLDWDGKTRRDQDMSFDAKSIESFIAQLFPSVGQTAPAVELQGQGIDLSQQIRVRATLSSSVILTYTDSNSDYDLQMGCSAQ